MRGGAALLNPRLLQLKDGLAGLFQSAKDRMTETREGTPFWIKAVVVLVIMGVVALYGWYFDLKKRLETPDNIRRFADLYRKEADAKAMITANLSSRKSLLAYLQTLQTAGEPAADLSLANFYISTVNAAGLFYPRVDGVISPDAATLAVQAGARAFVFDIWPDLRAGANFGPILQVVEQSSLWRRITLNALPFHVVLQPIVSSLYSNNFLNIQNGSKDAVILYLRFRGTPRMETYTAVAAALRDIMEPYRLDSSFYARRGEDRLFSTPITAFFSKVIVMSNKTAEGTILEDYVNFLQKGPTPDIREWDGASMANLTDAMQTEKMALLKTQLTVASPLPETEAAETNAWNWKQAHALGIQYAGMNLFYPSETLKEYMAPDMFGVYSYKLKPAVPVNLRYTIAVQQAVGYPNDPGVGTGRPVIGGAT